VKSHCLKTHKQCELGKILIQCWLYSHGSKFHPRNKHELWKILTQCWLCSHWFKLPPRLCRTMVENRKENSKRSGSVVAWVNGSRVDVVVYVGSHVERVKEWMVPGVVWGVMVGWMNVGSGMVRVLFTWYVHPQPFFFHSQNSIVFLLFSVLLNIFLSQTNNVCA